MIKREFLEAYLKERFGDVKIIQFERLGAGVHGTGYSLSLETQGWIGDYVIKELSADVRGHVYPSDRAAVFLLAYDEYKRLPKHIKPVDVLSLRDNGEVKSISGGKEYYLLMEKAEGVSYFRDLEGMKEKEKLHRVDRDRLVGLVDYLSNLHSIKKESKIVYWRKIRDIIGHGECLMGVFDSYPDRTLSYGEMADIEKLCVDWRAKLKPMYRRLCQIHGDFHPGNIWFRGADFVLLDRSRGPWGDAADDVTALTINYIFFSIKYHGKVLGAYLEALNLFYREYLHLTDDQAIFSIVAPFYAFRGAVVANPKFYPDLVDERRAMIFRFMKNVLQSETFELDRINDYMQ
jgi:hypothetical protein